MRDVRPPPWRPGPLVLLASGIVWGVIVLLVVLVVAALALLAGIAGPG